MARSRSNKAETPAKTPMTLRVKSPKIEKPKTTPATPTSSGTKKTPLSPGTKKTPLSPGTKSGKKLVMSCTIPCLLSPRKLQLIQRELMADQRVSGRRRSKSGTPNLDNDQQIVEDKEEEKEQRSNGSASLFTPKLTFTSPVVPTSEASKGRRSKSGGKKTPKSTASNKEAKRSRSASPTKSRRILTSPNVLQLKYEEDQDADTDIHYSDDLWSPERRQLEQLDVSVDISDCSIVSQMEKTPPKDTTRLLRPPLHSTVTSKTTPLKSPAHEQGCETACAILPNDTLYLSPSPTASPKKPTTPDNQGFKSIESPENLELRLSATLARLQFTERALAREKKAYAELEKRKSEELRNVLDYLNSGTNNKKACPLCQQPRKSENKAKPNKVFEIFNLEDEAMEVDPGHLNTTFEIHENKPTNTPDKNGECNRETNLKAPENNLSQSENKTDKSENQTSNSNDLSENVVYKSENNMDKTKTSKNMANTLMGKGSKELVAPSDRKLRSTRLKLHQTQIKLQKERVRRRLESELAAVSNQ